MRVIYGSGSQARHNSHTCACVGQDVRLRRHTCGATDPTAFIFVRMVSRPLSVVQSSPTESLSQCRHQSTTCKLAPMSNPQAQTTYLPCESHSSFLSFFPSLQPQEHVIHLLRDQTPIKDSKCHHLGVPPPIQRRHLVTSMPPSHKL